MKKISIITVFIFLVASAFPLMADSGHRSKRYGERDALILDSLNLNAEQTDKILNLKAAYLKEKDPLRSRLFNKWMELKLLWMQTKPDPDKIKSKQKEIHDLKWQLTDKRTEYRLAFRNILTPEQLSTYIVLKHEKKSRHKTRRRR